MQAMRHGSASKAERKKSPLSRAFVHLYKGSGIGCLTAIRGGGHIFGFHNRGRHSPYGTGHVTAELSLRAYVRSESTALPSSDFYTVIWVIDVVAWCLQVLVAGWADDVAGVDLDYGLAFAVRSALARGDDRDGCARRCLRLARR